MEKKNVKKRGFTIVELLTVMAVIAVLIGLLVPALGLVKDYAKRIQQKAQFHGIEVGLELYKTDFGSYVPSNDNQFLASPPPGFDVSPYGGANKLAEAMVGLDLLGFHPNANFRSDGANTVIDSVGVTLPDIVVYDTVGTYPNWQTGPENLNARKGPYLDLENANAFRLDEVYTALPAPFVNNFISPAAGAMYPLTLCDVYAKKRGGTGAKKTGSPILYYRARTNYQYQDSATDNNLSGNPDDDDIYNYYDNEEILLLGTPDEGVTVPHSIITAVGSTPQEEFDSMIVNDQVQSIRRPYQADSFILISAGKDGDFGTADDVFNFDKEIIE